MNFLRRWIYPLILMVVVIIEMEMKHREMMQEILSTRQMVETADYNQMVNHILTIQMIDEHFDKLENQNGH